MADPSSALGKSLAPPTVASLITPGYEDVQDLGSFFYLPDGSRECIEYDKEAAGLEMHVQYDLLEPFVVDSGTGLGLRCRRDIKRGENIVEFVGEVLDDTEVRGPPPPPLPLPQPAAHSRCWAHIASRTVPQRWRRWAALNAVRCLALPAHRSACVTTTRFPRAQRTT